MARGAIGDWTVAAEGLTEAVRGLRAVDRDMPKEVRKAAKASAEPIAADARQRFTSHFKNRSGKTQRNIKALATQTDARISFGASRPFAGKSGDKVAGGMEFGSDRRRQFRPWSGKVQSGSGSNGKFLYPAVRDGADGFRERVARGFDDVAARAGFGPVPGADGSAY